MLYLLCCEFIAVVKWVMRVELTVDEEIEFDSLSRDILSDEKVQEMKAYIQHGDVTTYDHVMSVARLCFRMAKRKHMNLDMQSLVKGALLHDFYLYDWHHDEKVKEHGLHGYTHAKTALNNALKHFKLNHIEIGIIKNHMWPLNITRLPNSKEAWLVCFVDKIVSTEETLRK